MGQELGVRALQDWMRLASSKLEDWMRLASSKLEDWMRLASSKATGPYKRKQFSVDAGRIQSSRGSSSQWTRDASNPAGEAVLSGRGTHPIQQGKQFSVDAGRIESSRGSSSQSTRDASNPAGGSVFDWTRDASNPAGETVLSRRGTHPIQQGK